jgi:hypothetical protein
VVLIAVAEVLVVDAAPLHHQRLICLPSSIASTMSDASTASL